MDWSIMLLKAAIVHRDRCSDLTILMLFLTCVVPSSLISTRVTTFRAYQGHNITSAEYSCPAVSTLSCARLCKGYSHCISFAFDRSAGVCHLQPVFGFGNSEHTETGVYMNNDPACKDGPTTVPHAAAVQWRRTLTSADANLTCLPDYLLNKEDAAVRCTSDGQVLPTDVQCLQRIWRNPVGDIRVSIPRTVVAGWFVCLTGTPTGNFNLSIETENNTSVSLQTTWTFGLLTPGLLQVENPLLGLLSLRESTTNPLSLNVPAVIKIFVNNMSALGSSRSFTLESFSHVVVKGYMSVSSLDLWCLGLSTLPVHTHDEVRDEANGGNADDSPLVTFLFSRISRSRSYHYSTATRMPSAVQVRGSHMIFYDCLFANYTAEGNNAAYSYLMNTTLMNASPDFSLLL